MSNETTARKRVSERKRKPSAKARKSPPKKQNSNAGPSTQRGDQHGRDSRDHSDCGGSGEDSDERATEERPVEQARESNNNNPNTSNNTNARGIVLNNNINPIGDIPPRPPVTVNGVSIRELVATTMSVHRSDESVRQSSQTSVENTHNNNTNDNENRVVISELREDKKRLSMLVDNLMDRNLELEKTVKHLKKELLVRNLNEKMSKPISETGRKSNNVRININSKAVVFCRTTYARPVPSEFIESLSNIPVVNNLKGIRQVLTDMYSRMPNLSEFFMLDKNYSGFINNSDMQHGGLSSITDEDEKVVIDWKTCGFQVNVQNTEGELDEELLDLAMFKQDDIHGTVVYVRRNPLERIAHDDYYDCSERKVLRYLTDHGYLYYRAVIEGIGNEEIITKSEFEDIIKECKKIQDRLVSCARSKYGTRKKVVKNMFLEKFGYNCDNQADRNRRRSDRCNTVVETSLCRLSKRKPAGGLVTNHWRHAAPHEIRCTECTIPFDEERERNQGDELFNSTTAWKVYEIFDKISFAPVSVEGGIATTARLDAWMTIVLTYFEEKQVSGVRGGNYITQIAADYNHLKIQSCICLLLEIKRILQARITLDEDETKCLADEFEVGYDEDEEKFIYSNSNTTFITYVPSNDGSKLFFYVKPRIFQKYVCPRMEKVVDCVIGYATRDEKKMKDIDLTCVDNYEDI